MIYSLYIINKAGGLIYQKDFADGLEHLSLNDYLVLASTLHSVHAITSKISPVPNSSGLQEFETDLYKLYCFQTLTGLKFIYISDVTHPGIDQLSKRVYELYADFVMKNPFYTPEMPIRCELFDTNLLKNVKPLQQ